jgi:heme exporter protein B
VVESLRLALAIAAKDLRAELRSRTSFLSAAMFAALLLVVFNFARDPTAVATIDLAPGILWVTVAFAAVVAMNRGFAVERENHAFDGLLLAPVSREVLFLGKYLANLTFVLLVEVIALPLFVLFFNVDLSQALPGLVATLLLATAGLVSVGTLFSAIVVRTRFAELMLPVLLLPFMVPPLVFAVQITMRLLTGRALSEVAGGLRLLVLYDVAFITISLLLFSAVVDE